MDNEQYTSRGEPVSDKYLDIDPPLSKVHLDLNPSRLTSRDTRRIDLLALLEDGLGKKRGQVVSHRCSTA